MYEAGDTHAQAMEWMRNYGKFNAGNLHTQDVLRIPGCPYLFVHEAHPVINLLRINKNMVGVDVDMQQKMDGYVRVTNSLFEASCDAIQNRILNRITTHDLNTLSVSRMMMMMMHGMSQPRRSRICHLPRPQIQLHRIGGVDWSHVNGADALMSFIPDPTWDSPTLEANIKVCICVPCQ